MRVLGLSNKIMRYAMRNSNVDLCFSLTGRYCIEIVLDLFSMHLLKFQLQRMTWLTIVFLYQKESLCDWAFLYIKAARIYMNEMHE